MKDSAVVWRLYTACFNAPTFPWALGLALGLNTRCINQRFNLSGTQLLWTALWTAFMALRQTFLTLSCLGHTDEPFAQTCTVNAQWHSYHFKMHLRWGCVCVCAALVFINFITALLRLLILVQRHLSPHTSRPCVGALVPSCYDIIALWQKISRLNGVNINGYWYHADTICIRLMWMDMNGYEHELILSDHGQGIFRMSGRHTQTACGKANSTLKGDMALRRTAGCCLAFFGIVSIPWQRSAVSESRKQCIILTFEPERMYCWTSSLASWKQTHGLQLASLPVQCMIYRFGRPIRPIREWFAKHTEAGSDRQKSTVWF